MASVTTACKCALPSACSPAKWMREITSAPNRTCGFTREVVPATRPVVRSTRAAARVVEPMSTATPNVASAGTRDSPFTAGSDGATRASAFGTIPSAKSDSSPNDFAAVDLDCGGMARVTSPSSVSWHPSRQPSAISAAVSSRASALVTPAAPSTTRTRHLAQTVRAPHGCSVQMSHCAAARKRSTGPSDTMKRSSGRNRMRNPTLSLRQCFARPSPRPAGRLPGPRRRGRPSHTRARRSPTHSPPTRPRHRPSRAAGRSAPRRGTRRC